MLNFEVRPNVERKIKMNFGFSKEHLVSKSKFSTAKTLLVFHFSFPRKPVKRDLSNIEEWSRFGPLVANLGKKGGLRK
jgi:hypothetical protein